MINLNLQIADPEVVRDNFYKVQKAFETPGSMVYPGAGIPVSTGSAWGTSISAGADGKVLTMVSGAPAWADAPIGLPSMTGNSGKFLTTDGTVASWSAVVASAAGSNGQVQFNNSGSLSGNSDLFWDNTYKRLGIGISAPTHALDVFGGIRIKRATSPYILFNHANLDVSQIRGTTNGLIFTNGAGGTTWASIINGRVGIGTGSETLNETFRVKTPPSESIVFECQYSTGGTSSPLLQQWKVSAGSGYSLTDGLGPLFGAVFSDLSGTFNVGTLGWLKNGSSDSADFVVKTSNAGTLSEKFRITKIGKIGIGVSPSANLHIKSSSGSLGTTPLKLTSGTNVTTPEDGAFEYDGTHLYFTIGTTRNILI